MERVALYTRVSSHEQATKGLSLAEQRERLGMWAKLQDWQVVDVYEDAGFSGGTDARPELIRLMADAKARRFDIVAVTKLDRFFRNTRLLLNYIFELKKENIAFCSQAEAIDTRNPGIGNVFVSLLGSMAEFERQRIGERMRDVRAHQASKGLWSCGRRPFGYSFDKQTKQLVIKPVEAETVRFIFKSYTQAEPVGVIQVTGKVIQAGLTPPLKGRRKHDFWTASAVRHVLIHPAYKGGPNERWRYITPAIIDSETWDNAQRRLSSNRHFRNTENHSPLQGLLKCGLCGHTIRTGYSHSTTVKVYECPGRLKRLHLDNTARCTLPRFKAEALEQRLEREVVSLFADPKTTEKWISATLDNLKAEKEALERKLKPIAGELEQTKNLMEKADTMFTVGRLSSEDYTAKIKTLKAKVVTLEKQARAADPMLIKNIDDTNKAVLYWQKYLDTLGKSGRDIWDFDSLDDSEFHPELLNNKNDLHFIPVEFNPNSEELYAPKWLRKLGLTAYIYPKKIVITGVIRQTKVNATCTSARYPRFQ